MRAQQPTAAKSKITNMINWRIDWHTIDTVLLDMDGTLLDLRYDNTLWNELLPRRYSQVHGVTLEHARRKLFAKMRQLRGKLVFYCLDHWASYTRLNIVALHDELAHLIVYRPNAEMFLDHLTALGKRSLLVTNAHRDSLAVKDRHANLLSRVDSDVSCHDYGAPKEHEQFWQRLRENHPYDPARTLLIDDNDAVLRAAQASGIAHLVTVSQPDSSRPPRLGLTHQAFNDFREIIPTS